VQTGHTMNSPNVEMGVAITTAEGSVGLDKKIETLMKNYLSNFFTISAFYNTIFWEILLCFIYFSVITRVSLKFAFSPYSIPNEFKTKRQSTHTHKQCSKLYFSTVASGF
jgi:hypothetical protein